MSWAGIPTSFENISRLFCGKITNLDIIYHSCKTIPMDDRNREPTRRYPLEEATEKVKDNFDLDDTQENSRVFYDPAGSWIYIDRFTSPTHGEVGEVRVQQWQGSSKKDLFLYLNLTDNYRGAFDLAGRLQAIGLPVTEIKPHAAYWKPDDPNIELIDSLNLQLANEWKKKQEEK